MSDTKKVVSVEALEERVQEALKVATSNGYEARRESSRILYAGKEESYRHVLLLIDELAEKPPQGRTWEGWAIIEDGEIWSVSERKDEPAHQAAELHGKEVRRVLITDPATQPEQGRMRSREEVEGELGYRHSEESEDSMYADGYVAALEWVLDPGPSTCQPEPAQEDLQDSPAAHRARDVEDLYNKHDELRQRLAKLEGKINDD